MAALRSLDVRILSYLHPVGGVGMSATDVFSQYGKGTSSTIKNRLYELERAGVVVGERRAVGNRDLPTLYWQKEA